MKITTKRNWFWAAAVIGAAIWGFAGCATAPKSIEVETVGQLNASQDNYSNVYSKPVHATTDLAPSFGVVDTDEDVTTGPSAVVVPAAEDVPVIAPKDAHGF